VSNNGNNNYRVPNKASNNLSNYNLHQHQAQSMDRLRVDLMRTKLSVKTAEDKAKRLEMELEEMRRKYEGARRELGEERARQIRYQNRQVQRGLAKNQTQKPLTSAQEGARLATTTAGGDATSERPCPSEALPPFAAALFANAEREERERRMQQGLIEKADDGEHSNELAPRIPSRGAEVDVRLATTAGLNDLASAVVLGAEVNQTYSLPWVSASLPRTVATKARRVNNDSPNVDADATKDAQIQNLVKRCAKLTRQRESLERKLTLSQADKVIVHTKSKEEEEPEEEGQHGTEREERAKEKEALQLELQNLSTERDAPAERPEDRESIPLVTKLLCDLLRDRLSDVAKGVRGRGPPGRARDRTMLEVGGGAVDDESDGGGSGGRGRRRLRSAMRGLLRRTERASPRRRKRIVPKSGDLDDATPKEERNVDSSLLVRKKRRRPRLFRSEDDAPTSPDAVPAFLRKEEEEERKS